MTSRRAVIARLHQLFDEWAGQRAIQFEGAWTTWGDVARVHRALVGALATAAPHTADTVAIVMRQRPALVAAELAVLATGRTAVLVSPLQGDRALVSDVIELGPAILIAHELEWERPGLADAAERQNTLGLTVDDALGLAVRVGTDEMPAGPTMDAAVTVLTSGTTGPPSRLPVSWDSFVRLGGGPDGRPATSDHGAMILSLPLVTLGGLLSLARLVFGGRPLAMMERFDVHHWAGLVVEHRPTIIGAPPTVVQMILDADIPVDHFEGVTAFMTASAPVEPAVARAFEERYGIPVLVGYGATEFLGSVTGWTPALWREFGRTKLGSVGRALPGVRIRVLDPSTLDHQEPSEVAAGEEGVVEVDPPERAGQLPAGWLRTADRARIDADGFVWILGRSDDVIIRGGFKIDLPSVEAVLRQHPDVIDVAVIGRREARLGTVPVAAVVVRGGAELTDEALTRWARDRLAPYAVPAATRFVDAIPTTSTFKTHRAALQELFARDDHE